MTGERDKGGGRPWSQMVQEFAFYSIGDGNPLELIDFVHGSLCCLRISWSESKRGTETVMEKQGACLASNGVAGDGENIHLSYEVDTELTGFADGSAVGRRESDLAKQRQNWTQLSSVCWRL